MVDSGLPTTAALRVRVPGGGFAAQCLGLDQAPGPGRDRFTISPRPEPPPMPVTVFVV